MPRLLFLLALASFVPALQADLFFDATLLPGNEVPPHVTPAFGFITVDLHTDMTTLDVDETFNNLTTVASAAHTHCCAPAGTNAAVVLPFVGFPSTVSGTYTHTFNLNTDLTGINAATFIAALETGNTYANIHNATFPGGEIRGQLTAVPEPHSVVVLGGCLLALALFRRRFA